MRKQRTMTGKTGACIDVPAIEKWLLFHQKLCKTKRVAIGSHRRAMGSWPAKRMPRPCGTQPCGNWKGALE